MGARSLRRIAVYGTLIVLGALVYANRARVLAWYRGEPYRTVDDVAALHGPRVEARYRPIIERAGLTWPPSDITLVAFKHERVLEVWATPAARLGTFPVTGASGTIGPKRTEGDLQVPEGIYPLVGLNPNSRYRLSVEVGYPNDDDAARANGKRDGMGGEIFVHGGAASIGCLAIGDDAIDDVFTLVALADRRTIIIAPVDLRRPPVDVTLPNEPALYDKVRGALAAFPLDVDERAP